MGSLHLIGEKEAEEFLEHPDRGRIYHVKQPALPQFQFEWHPRVKRLYLIRLGLLPTIGEVIAHDVKDMGMAINYMLVWCRGFKEGKTPPLNEDERLEKIIGSGEV